mmetsp:Transcript_15543/g.46103  ORF Transcript_15543/g.46103 Transcript_15543/m.46103 type:complete len:2307 (-) Transcript_15543:50-6970(-)
MADKKAAPGKSAKAPAQRAPAPKAAGPKAAGAKAPPKGRPAQQQARPAAAAGGQSRPPSKVNKYSACFLVTKHSWKGKYKRLFCIGQNEIATLNHQTFEETNVWPYGDDLVDVMPSMKAEQEFNIVTKKKGKSTTITFSSPHRTDLLAELQSHRRKFVGSAGQPEDAVFSAYKQHWSESRKDTILSAWPTALVQLGSKNRVVAKYNYQDIEALVLVSDYPGGFAVFYGGFGRMHLFALENRDQLLRRISEHANNYLGIQLSVKKKTITLDQFRDNRLGRFANDVAITSLTEFTVNKISLRHGNQPVQRIFATSEVCILERDPATYSVICARPLSDVSVLIRAPDDPQKFSIEYIKGDIRTYLSTERDAMLASLLDSIRAAGNRNVCIQMHRSLRGERFSPYSQPPDEEIESTLLKFLGTPTAEVPYSLAVLRFNMNIEYSGLLHAVSEEGWFKENKEKLITNALNALLTHGEDTRNAGQLAGEFMAIRRLVASKAGFAAFTWMPNFKEQIGQKVVKAIKRDNDAVTVAALDMLSTLMQPMHEQFDLGQEALNKQSLLASKPFIRNLANLLKHHAEKRTGALVISGLLDIFTFALCPPYSETTDGGQFDMVLATVANLGRSLFHLFEHASLAIVKAAGLIMRAIIEEGTAEHVTQFQYFALAEGAVLRHMHTALYTQSTDSRLLMHRQLSRHLIALWTYDCELTDKLLRQVLPAGLLEFLNSEETVPEKEIDRMHGRDNLKAASTDKSKKLSSKKLENLTKHWRAKNRKAGAPDPKKPVTLRRRRQNIKVKANWDFFYYSFYGDHARADLIWNFKTREELREAIEGELRAFTVDKDLRGDHVISWNHTEFELRYETLAEEVKIGDHYLRLLLEDDPKTTKIHNPVEFFNDLYHRFLLTTVPAMKAMCLQALAIVYGQCWEEIGNFNDTEYIVTMLNRCEDNMERDRLLEFLAVLLRNRKNVKLFIDAGGLRALTDLVTLAHLHTTRANVPLQNDMLQASNSALAEDEAEWYYSKSKDPNQRKGPIGFIKLKEMYDEGEINKETRVWAQGMDGWRPIRKVPQLKWTMVAEGQPIMDFSSLAVLCLNMLLRICEVYPSKDADGAIVRPLPRAKRYLSDQNCLPHLVQLLLTFDPIIVEKVSLLLSNIMTDNSQMSRVYMTGLFFFIMMYTGSNVIPIATLLNDLHNFQAFQSEDSGPSVLNAMLPEALVCYLDNHGIEKFSTSFLGEFDTPEVIWGNQMRMYMIQKIALHLADFSPRLQSNTRAMYQYCPIPKVVYPRLENELFCSIYYLRNLCDEARFPEWPIRDHIQLLKDVLDQWKIEVEKKPETMSMEEAYETLGLDPAAGEVPQSKIRKAYFKMSMKYHPDKNPEGRDMFEKVNKCYEYITTKAESKANQGTSPENLVLILRAQSILFKRFKEELAPYKYAGYPMLISTIERETSDEGLFAGDVGLLESACELAHLTVDCSPLNAEELRREGGIEHLMKAMQRCISVIQRDTKDEEPPIRVCLHIVRCFSAAAQFEECRVKIMELPQIISDVCRCLWFTGAPAVTFAAQECVCAFAVDEYLQNHMLQAGVLYHLLLAVFNYDYTLEEGGVEVDAETNAQKFANNIAKQSIKCLARLGGYKARGGAGTPENPTVQKIVRSLITPYLNSQISGKDNMPVLKLLNSNSETPYLIWDNGTRAELTDYLEAEQEKAIKTGDCDPSLGANFAFSAHSCELIIADVFVRIYNEQPQFPLKNAKRFAMTLIDFVGKQAQWLFSNKGGAKEEGEAGDAEGAAAEAESADALSPEEVRRKRIEHTCMALVALRNVIKANSGLEVLLRGHFKLIFSLLRYSDEGDMQYSALEVIAASIGNKECVTNIAESRVLAYLLVCIEKLPQGRTLAVEIMHGLTSNPKMLVEVLKSGALLYFLDMYCNGNSPAIREATAALFGKMIAEKLRGPKVKITLSKFLPVIFMDAMQDNPEASVTMFEGTHENPELIWNDDARQQVQRVVKELKTELFEQQLQDPSVTWSLPPDFEVVYENVGDDVVVGGVFLSLLIKTPGWVFRKPKEFLVGSMEKFIKILSKKDHTAKDARQLETITEALVKVFHAQKELAAQVPGLGHVHKLMPCFKRKHPEMSASLLSVCNELASNEQGVRCFAGMDSISYIKMGIQSTVPSALASGMEMMAKLFEANAPPLVAQAVKAQLPQVMLDILKGQLDTIEGGSAAKAHCVKALKAMSRDLTHGEAVTAVLDACSWWATYKDQRHDLFITQSSVAGYLTGPTAKVAGYLTQAPTTAAMGDEPPMEDDEAAAAPAGRGRLADLLGDD